MQFSSVYPPYQGAPSVNPNGTIDIYFYNDTGAALADGYIGMLSWELVANADSEPVLYPILKTPQTEGVAVVQLAVVNGNADASVADATWGLARIYGEVNAKCDGTTDLALGDQLEVLTDGVSFIEAAAATSGDAGDILDECAAIAMEVYTLTVSANKLVFLLGKQVVIAGS